MLNCTEGPSVLLVSLQWVLGWAEGYDYAGNLNLTSMTSHWSFLKEKYVKWPAFYGSSRDDDIKSKVKIVLLLWKIANSKHQMGDI